MYSDETFIENIVKEEQQAGQSRRKCDHSYSGLICIVLCLKLHSCAKTIKKIECSLKHNRTGIQEMLIKEF